jgi:hypothetical protein
MPRKKNPSNNYFHSGVEEAIHLYNKSESELERNRIFTIIYPALAKISEVMYNKVKPTYMDGEIDEIMMDCTCYLSERLFRVKDGKGKAFSYMTVCARNYYIFHNTRAYTDTKKTLKLDVLNENWDIADEPSARVEEMETSAKLLSAFVDYMDENKEKFVHTKKGNVVVAAVIDFLRDVDSIEDFNRRNIMNDLTEINGYKVDRHYITKVFNRLQMHFSVFSKEWLKTGKSIPFWDKAELTAEEVKFCVENYTPNKGGLSIVGLSKKFNVEEYTVRKELYKAGLAAYF